MVFTFPLSKMQNGRSLDKMIQGFDWGKSKVVADWNSNAKAMHKDTASNAKWDIA